MNNIIFVPGQDLIDGIGLIIHVGGNLFDVRHTASPRPSITGHFFDAMQVVIVVVDALELADPVPLPKSVRLPP